MSRLTPDLAAGIIRRHRISIGSLWRKLNPGQQALLVLDAGVLAELEAAGLVTLAGKGYQGSTYANIPYKGKNKPY